MMIAEQIIPLGDKAAIDRTVYLGNVIGYSVKFATVYQSTKEAVGNLLRAVKKSYKHMVGPQPPQKPKTLKEMLKAIGRGS